MATTHRWTRAQLLILADHDRIIRRGSVAVKLWEDGSITRADVDLGLTQKMKVGEVVELLKLKVHELGHTVTGQ